MHCDAVGVEVHRRDGKQNAFLLHPRQYIFRQQNPAHCLELRFQQVEPQSLSPEKIRYEPVTSLNDGKRSKRLETQVGGGHIRPFSLRRLMRVEEQALPCFFKRGINSCRSELPRSEIWLGT